MKKLSFLFALAILTTSLFSFCSVKKEGQKNTVNYTMNNGDYNAEWKAIDSLEMEGLPKSALEKVELLYTKVKSKNDPSQIIKCLLYKAKYQSQLEEDGLVKAIYRMQEQVGKEPFPAKQILHSVLAEMYNNYLQRNQWKFTNRTETQNFKTDDIRTWTIKQLLDESKKHYWLSLENDQIKTISIDNFNPITSGGHNNAKLRPTLFDFLAHRAIDFFSNDRSHLTEPSYKFYINQKEAFAPAEEFVKFNFPTKDKESQKLQTLLLFQELLAFRLADNNEEALMDADIKRLRFLNKNATLDNKENLHLQALESLESKYKNNPFSSEISVEIANIYYRRGQRFKLNSDGDEKWDIKKALEICESVIKRYPDVPEHVLGVRKCQNLKDAILSSRLQLTTEGFNIAQKPFLGLLKYRNVEKVHFRVVPIDDEVRNKIEELRRKGRKEEVDYITGLDHIRTWSLDLPQIGDYREHSTELKVDGLDYGDYIILMSVKSNFEGDDNILSYNQTTISNIAFFQRNNSTGRSEFVVVDRESGEPLNGVKVEFFEQNYDQKKRRYVYKKGGEQTTNDKGIAVANLALDKYFQVKFTKGDDVLFNKDGYSNYRRDVQNRTNTSTRFFLDRAIYRPGQTIYFKGIIIHTDKDRMPSIVPNKKQEVTLYDANRQEVETVTLTSNEYGTYNGTFTAPKSGLLGNMSIQIKNGDGGNGYKAFRVEEYKRPKFEVSFKPVDKAYRLNDTVSVNGHAQAFAGSNIDGAKVQYRVVRRVSYPYWYRYGWYPNRAADMEIVNGETNTDEKGEFKVDFAAIPDLSSNPKHKPQFNYTIYADVTDITGETHSSQTQVSVGYIALEASIKVNNTINKDSLQSIEIATKNLNGQFEAATGSFIIEKLKEPNRIFRQRTWQEPDQFVMTKEEFYKDFPNDPYKDEGNFTKWEKEVTVFETSFDTEKSKELDLSKLNLKPGRYLFKINTQDKYGEKVTVQQSVHVYDLKAKQAVADKVDFFVMEKSVFEPGEIAEYYFGSAYENINVLYELEFDGKIIQQEWLSINEIKKLSFRIEEKHRGNLFYHFSFVKKNRPYSNSGTIVVPWTNKELNIEYATFRDKLSPGQEEEWRIKISGSKKEKIAAEMMATMYDASLDEFVVNDWSLSLFPMNYQQQNWSTHGFGQSRFSVLARYNRNGRGSKARSYKSLNWFGFNFYEGRYRTYSAKSRRNAPMHDMAAPMAAPPGEPQIVYKSETYEEEVVMPSSARSEIAEDADAAGGALLKEVGNGNGGETGTQGADVDLSQVKVRTNLKETVFFFPELMTDENGDVILKFTMNEALTKWKFLGLAHTKDLKIGLTKNEVVTQKELMVFPNAPRFFREGDEIEFTAKVSNLTEKIMNGSASLELYDAITMQRIDKLLGNDSQQLSFKAGPGQSDRLAWKLKIPFGKAQAITHRVVARSGDYSDGEESSLPVLTNRMLVTETLPLPVRGKETKDFTFTSMEKASQSTSLQHHKMTLEFTSNPAWYAVQALPYLMEYPYKCTEQVFSRYYANTLASNVANSHPKVKKIFDQWKNTDAMLSNLSKNQELKSALLEETPWVLQAQSEEEQKKNIGILFDLNRMGEERAQALQTLQERQLGNGGFAWFPGGRDNWYITQYLVEGIGHLSALGVDEVTQNGMSADVLQKAVRYIDDRIVEHYEDLKRALKNDKEKLAKDNLDYMAIHYLYARSFYGQFSISKQAQKVKEYYLRQADKYWLNKGIYMEGMLALALTRDGRNETPAKIVKSLKERSLNNDEMGMYWKYNTGYYWHQLPIETHAMMIEVFDEVANDEKAVDDLKVWLLKTKQTTHWKTTKATSAAVYALLRRGANWLLEDQPVQITMGDKKIDQSKLNVEAGTGYFKTSWDGEEVNNSMSKIRVENPNNVVAWGAAYWQYFEDLDKIKTFEETPLTLKKQLFKETNSDTGPVITPVTETTQLQPGDKLKVRIELKVDRIMEYVHMKDMRASGFEPMNVLSSYKWQGGLGYYESTKDASTNFFISFLPKGTYVFEYPLRVAHNGDFSNGITTIQCMYAPEFTSHSEGVRVKVK